MWNDAEGKKGTIVNQISKTSQQQEQFHVIKHYLTMHPPRTLTMI